MAQTISANIVPGFTRLTGSGNPGGTSPGPTKPTGIIIQDSGGYDYYLWVDTAGKIRTTDAATAEADAFNWNTGGTVVGAQTT